MSPERTKTPQERGKILCDTISLLTPANFPTLTIARPDTIGGTISLTDEYGVSKQWDKFVQFPPELSGLFPGSYVSPGMFLDAIGKKDNQEVAIQKIVSNEMGESFIPKFAYNERDFNLRIMNGMTNSSALTMSRLALEVSDEKKYPDGFASDSAAGIRAEYQDAMFSNIKNELARAPEKMPAVRIHDDCLASGDSIISYLYDRIQDAGELKRLQNRGVDIIIDGAATAQGILYLRAFAHAFNIPLELTAGHMAFGLTAGENGKHANYITYPPQTDKDFYDNLNPAERAQVESFGDMGAVAGDMGEAEKGIEKEVMIELRKIFGEDYCSWNDERTDNHGNHERAKEGIVLQKKIGEFITDYVYFARGGFLPFAFDKRRPDILEHVNILIIRLSRLNVIRGEKGNLGYGAGFTKADGVTHLDPIS